MVLIAVVVGGSVVVVVGGSVVVVKLVVVVVKLVASVVPDTLDVVSAVSPQAAAMSRHPTDTAAIKRQRVVGGVPRESMSREHTRAKPPLTFPSPRGLLAPVLSIVVGRPALSSSSDLTARCPSVTSLDGYRYPKAASSGSI